MDLFSSKYLVLKEYFPGLPSKERHCLMVFDLILIQPLYQNNAITGGNVGYICIF